MKLLRNALTLASLLFLTVGYASSQVYALQGRAAEYTALLSQTPVAILSLVLLLAAIIFAFMPDSEGETT